MDLLTLGTLFYLSLGAFIANMAPIFAKKFSLFPQLDIPLDLGIQLFGKPLTGKNKTLRGLLVGGASALGVGALQYFLHKYGIIFLPPAIASGPQILLFSFLAGFGALIGDAAESILKRQIGIPPGRPFIPFDQIDYLGGFLLFTYPLIHWSFSEALIILTFGIILNPLTNALGYVLGLKDTYW